MSERGADTVAQDPRIVSPAEACIAYKQVFSTGEGQVVLADLLRRFGHARASTFDDNHGRMALAEGQRTVLVHIGRMLDADPAELDAQEDGNAIF